MRELIGAALENSPDATLDIDVLNAKLGALSSGDVALSTLGTMR